MHLESTVLRPALAPASAGNTRIGDGERKPGAAVTNLYAEHINPHLAELLAKLRLDKRFVRGEGCELFDEAGRRYLDCIAAYGALPFGFNPRPIWKALWRAQRSGEPSLVQPSLLEAAGQLAARLVQLAPGELRYVTFTNSGAEAIEAAIKMCRAATGRPGVLSTTNSFHGKTLGALSATGNADYQHGFAAPAPDFDKVRFGDAEALRRLLAEKPSHYAAFIVEPIQGEGGIVEPPAGYLTAVREICHQAGVLLVFDEVQTGLGRTGRLFACEAEGVAPDVMTLAKALGGGLMPIGAVLCTAAVFTETFATKHSSTFAGNSLACRAGLATLDLLTAKDGALIERVRRNGRRLKARLEALRRQYPHLIAEICGRGYMLGIRFGVDAETWSDSVLGTAAAQQFFTPIFASYMLNVEGVRVAPTLNGKAVIRIEPPLIFRWRHCEELLGALESALESFSEGDSGRVLGAILDGVPRPPSAFIGRAAPRRAIAPNENETRFAFLVHPLQTDSYSDFDPSLASLDKDELAWVAGSLSGLVEPFVLSRARVTSKTGHSVYGEFIVVPWTARELSDMPREQAMQKVQAALQLAKGRGAQLVGLGAFTSVVTRGGLSVSREGVPVTTGNSYTAVASAEALGLAFQRMGDRFGGHVSAAVVGATGAIGRAMALLLAEGVGQLILIGNSARAAAQVRQRLLAVASDVCRHLALRYRNGCRFLPNTTGERLLAIAGGELDPNAPAERVARWIEGWEREGTLLVGQEIGRVLPLADVVVAATSATGTVIDADDLRPGAVVCDLSRPANVSTKVAAARPDTLVIDGGIVAVPGCPHLGNFGLEPGLSYACMGETMMLALDGHLRNTSLGTDLAPDTLRLLQASAERHGFRVAQFRSFGRPLGEADWNRFLAARQAMQLSRIAKAC